MYSCPPLLSEAERDAAFPFASSGEFTSNSDDSDDADGLPSTPGVQTERDDDNANDQPSFLLARKRARELRLRIAGGSSGVSEAEEPSAAARSLVAALAVGAGRQPSVKARPSPPATTTTNADRFGLVSALLV